MLLFLFFALFLFLPLCWFAWRGLIRFAVAYPRSIETDPGCWIESIAESDADLAKRLGVGGRS